MAPVNHNRADLIEGGCAPPLLRLWQTLGRPPHCLARGCLATSPMHQAPASWATSLEDGVTLHKWASGRRMCERKTLRLLCLHNLVVLQLRFLIPLRFAGATQRVQFCQCPTAPWHHRPWPPSGDGAPNLASWPTQTEDTNFCISNEQANARARVRALARATAPVLTAITAAKLALVQHAK